MKECPFLGLADDPGTRASYPSIWNCCQHVKPVEAVNLAYQDECCLSERYLKCLVYRREEMDVLPDELRISQKILPTQKKLGWKAIILIVIVVVNLILALLNMIIHKRAEIPPTGNQNHATVQFAPPISTVTFETIKPSGNQKTQIVTLTPASSATIRISPVKTITPP